MAKAGYEKRWSRIGLKIAALLAFDGAIAALALGAAYYLRFEGNTSEPHFILLPEYMLCIAVSRVMANVLLRLHRWSFRFSGLPDALRIGVAGVLGSGLFLLFIFFLQLGRSPYGILHPPRSTLVMEFLMSTTLMGLVRFSPRVAHMLRVERALSRRKSHERTCIVGAGATGEQLLRDLLRSDEHRYKVIGFVDDDPGKRGTYVCGRPVLGSVSDLPKLVDRHDIGTLLIAIPRLPARRVREMLSLCADLKLRFKVLPVSYVYLQERNDGPLLSDLSPEDLLQREEVDLRGRGISEKIRGRCVLVTGAAGSIGSEICRQLLQNEVGTLVLADMNENALYLQQRFYEREFPRIRIVGAVADVRDRNRMLRLFSEYRPQDVFHAAAHKHVPLMEWAPCEAVKNNILGTRNAVEAAHEAGVERFVFISTDKAVRPTSIMGASKRVGEMVVRAMARRSETRFAVVRFGNVLGSAGSVVPLFREQIASGGPVTVTHPEVRRYFMTIKEAVGLVLEAAYRDFGELCILDMGEPMRIVDLARHMITMAGLVPEVDVPIEFIGLRPGEKLSEELLTDSEESTRRVSGKIFIASSPPPPPDLEEHLRDLAAAAEKEDRETVVVLLRKLVPSYAPNGENGREKETPARPAGAAGR